MLPEDDLTNNPSPEPATTPAAGTEPAGGVVADSATPAPAAAAPEAGKPAQPKSALDAVLAGLEKAAAAPAAPGATPAAAGGEPPAGESDPGTAAQPGGEKPLGEAGQKRLRELVSENKSLLPKARYFDQMSSWARQHGLDQQDITYALDLIRLVKNDPASARKQLEPLMKRVLEAAGEQLPDDLQEELSKGLITEERAKELARARVAERINSERGGRESAARTAEANRREVERIAGGIGTAVSQWETNWQKADPDYAKKQKFVSAEITRLMSVEGVPLTAEEAVQQAQKALDTINDSLSGILPKPRAKDPATGGSAPRTTAQAKTSLEAAEQGLARSRQAA